VKNPSLQTHHTIEANELADAVNASLGRVRLAPGDYVPSLTAPEGPSTGGGVQALQHLRLVPQQAGFQTLLVGSANQVEGVGELRSYDYVNAAYQARFRKPVPLDPNAYAEFLQMAKSLLEVMRLRVSVANTPDDLAVSNPPSPLLAEPRPGRKGTPIVLAVVAIALSLALVSYLLTRH
jgi:hypothetical protein